MTPLDDNDPNPSSWHKIKQGAGRRATTALAQRRRLRVSLRHALAVLVALLIAASVGALFYWHHTGALQEAVAKHQWPIREVFFETDGVLDHAWLERELDLPLGVTLDEIDVQRLRSALLFDQQVLEARVERMHPDVLKVQIQERQPVLRLVIINEAGDRELRLVSDRGVVFKPHGYVSHSLRQMPFLDGVQLERNGAGFAVIAGLAEVDELLRHAREILPNQAADWFVVDLRDFGEGPEDPSASIVIRRRDETSIRFALPDFPAQLERLRYIQNHGAVAHGLGREAHIDLRLDTPTVQLAEGRTGLRF